LVIFNSISKLHFNTSVMSKNNYDIVIESINLFIDEHKPNNFIIIDMDKALGVGGVATALDTRGFYSSKNLYSIDFLKEYAMIISPCIQSITGSIKKVLVLDCDNTLWAGILGEDGHDGVKMSAHSYPGNIYYEIQSLALSLSQKGVILAICSKNNIEDVKKIIIERNDFQIPLSSFSSLKVNWKDKAQNLIEMASELNLGLDSFIFLDDSDFEIELIRQVLPEVKSIKVPSILDHYPEIFRELMKEFTLQKVTKEDLLRAQMYEDDKLRENSNNEKTNLAEYLSTLGIKITIELNSNKEIPRISQLTLKTNQFNFRTQRYTESDIIRMMSDTQFKIYSLSVEDKFGKQGLTGLIILKIKNKKAFIDTFLLSCRILGRTIENSFLNHIINELKKNEIEILEGEYLQTLKNEQVKNFYSNYGFQAGAVNTNIFELKIDHFIFKKDINYIEVINGTKN
ncbi:MAG: HAD-IIIC family phosphatase, partial [Bacteriovorax sp.]|nr:HAD-IIIC family phosphatase [Bacteriovorax sp.]